MKTCKIIPFESTERLLARAAKYAESVELFLEESDKAAPLLLKALEHADCNLKQRIIFLVGGFAKERAAAPLYRLLADPDEEEEVRHAASVQLSIILPLLGRQKPLMDRLLKDLRSPDPDLRMCACFALGWKGADAAVIPIIDLLYDEDLQVQLSAVNALVNLHDDRVLNLLLERLEHGPMAQKRCILFNLWRLHSRGKRVAAVYIRYLMHEEADLRLEALAFLDAVTPPGECLPVYRRCLGDEEPRVRKLAVEKMATLGDETLPGRLEEIRGMLSDPDMAVKGAAVKILRNGR